MKFYMMNLSLWRMVPHLRSKPYIDPDTYDNYLEPDEFSISSTGFRHIDENGVEHDGSYVCSVDTMRVLKEVLDPEANQIISLWDKNDDSILLGYTFEPAVVNYSIPYPTYAQIAKELPSNIHYFQKYPDADFPLVNDRFVDLVKAHKFKGINFSPRFDGKKVLGVKCKL